MKYSFTHCLFLFSLLFLTVSMACADEIGVLVPDSLTTEAMTNPVGLDTQSPRLSWKSTVADGLFNRSQSAWQILVADDLKSLARDHGNMWDSGKVVSAISLNIPYAGKILADSGKYYWKVRVWDNEGKVSKWSPVASWTTGIFKPENWKAKWIAMPEKFRETINLDHCFWIGSNDTKAGQIWLRREFQLEVSEADLNGKSIYGFFHYAGNKKFEIFVNGKKAGFSIGMVFNPNQLRTLDISEYLRAGKNVVAVTVSEPVKAPCAFLAKMEIGKIQAAPVAEDRKPSARGSKDKTLLTFGTDKNWLVSHAGAEGWNTLDFKSDSWKSCSELYAPDAGSWGVVHRNHETASPLFEKKFKVAKEVDFARLHISGIGFYEAFLDGKKIGDKCLDPPPTNYNKTVLYSTYDLTDSLRSAAGKEKSLRVMLGHGWYDVRSVVTWNFDAAPWRDFPRLIAQLVIQYKDGTRETVLSDESWTALSSPCLFDCIRQGEIWQGGHEPRPIGQATVVTPPKGKLTAESFPGTKVVREFQPKTVHELSPGLCVVDLGWNIAGWCRITLRNTKPGDVIRFRYSERFDLKKGIERFDIAQHFMEGSPAMIAGQKGGFQTDFFICRGAAEETFEPHFTYNGFQFLEISGYRTLPAVTDISAKIVRTSFSPRGEFKCSNDLINKIQAATLFSYEGNYVNSYPTDCPHREKNGWTGDAQLAVEQAMYNWDNSAAYEKWVGDLIDEQQPDGNLPGIVPTGGWGYPWGNGPAWDSSLLIIPWTLYCYGDDIRILEKSYPAMKKYIGFMTTKATNHLVAHGLGDWVPAKTVTPTEITSSGYYYIDTMITAQTALLLGHKEEAKQYLSLAANIRNSYFAKHQKENGIIANGGQTAQATAIHQGMAISLSDEQRTAIVARLSDAVSKANGFIDFGILGSKYVFRTLSDYQKTAQALEMILQEKQPCFADWIKRGAGTLWEDWQDGSSRNHIMFGDVSAWFYQALAGIKLYGGYDAAVAQYPLIPGRVLSKISDDEKRFMDAVAEKVGTQTNAFKVFRIEPQCRKSDLAVHGKNVVSWVDAKVDSPYGPIRSAWKWNANMTELTAEFVVPVNTMALVTLPFEQEKTVSPQDGTVLKFAAGNKSMFLLGSGSYRFQVRDNQ